MKPVPSILILGTMHLDRPDNGDLYLTRRGRGRHRTHRNVDSSWISGIKKFR